MLSSRIELLIIVPLFALAACSMSSANPMFPGISGRTIKKDSTHRGVVNGLWQFDAQQNGTRLQSINVRATASEAEKLSGRWQVRVGINRGYISAGTYLEVVLLPEGWSYSLDDVIDNGRTINVGDVVDVFTPGGTRISTVASIIRKCNAAPVAHEKGDWDIGCKQVKEFDANGYGGEKYYLTTF